MRWILPATLLTLSACNLFEPSAGAPDGPVRDMSASDSGRLQDGARGDFGTSDASPNEDLDATSDPDLGPGPDLGSDLGPQMDDGGVDASMDMTDQGDDWWDDAWTSRVSLSFDLNAVSAAAAGVPVPLVLDPAFASLAQEGGGDLRVVDPNGSPVDHEVVVWGSEPIVWVRVDLDPADAGPHAFAYVGNPTAPSTASPAAVWSEYDIVLHFETDDLTRSSIGNWNALLDGTPAPGPGQIGGAMDAANGTFRYLRGQNDVASLDLGPGDKRTFSACFSTPMSVLPQTLIWNEGNCLGWSLAVAASGPLRQQQFTGSMCGDFLVDEVLTPAAVDDGQWHCATSRVDRAAGTMVLSVDGAHVATGVVNTTDPALSTSALRIGTNYNETQNLLGSVDEVWISEGIRSDAWVEASHAALRAGFVTFGDVETRP